MTDAGPESAAAADIADCRPRCPRCRAGTEHLPPSARYCPRCGTALAEHRRAAVTPPPPPPPLPAVAQRSAPQHPGYFVPRSTDIVAGYGEALYRLGRRYEAGVGWRHHPGEAVRCFTKAARLGNAKALERLVSPDEVGPTVTPLHH